MARLNTHPSATPQYSRSATVDSLYADPPPGARLNAGSAARQSSYSVMSPAQSMNSDKENEIPESRQMTPRPTSKGRRMAGGRPQRLPTPVSGSSSSSGNANKRRRTGDYSMGESDIYEDGDDGDGPQTYEDEEEQDEQGLPTPNDDEEDEEEGGSRYYNPHQDPEKRRILRASIRNHHREMEDNRDDLIRPESGALADAIVRQNHLMSKVRQTGDATLDSRVLVLASDYAAKKLNASLHGNVGVGVDVDQFVSRCIFFMKEGRPAGSKEVASTQAPRRRQPVPEDEEDEENNGEGLDWALLGRYACFPNNKRPPVSSFLLGPLSVQKRARLQTRRARAQRQPLGPATRPQELRHEDIIQSENSNLTNLVKGIKTRLQQHINDGEVQIEEELKAYPNYDDEDVSAACKRYRVYQTPEGEAAVSLFDFAINPRSFGQTVENLFYISFLIREGAAKVLTDADELPLLVPEEPRNLQQQRELHVEKHQAIFSLDWPTWKTLIKAFDIKVPLIPHRVPDETNVTAGGWYG